MIGKLNCIAVDDEPLALQLVESYINRTPFLNLLGSFGSAEEAVESIPKEEVDIAFLDIQMPGVSGLQLSRMLGDRTKVIFITAYDKFAIEAYKVNAVGYLLKPISYDEFLEEAMKTQKMFQKETDKDNSVETRFENETILVKSDYKMFQIPIKEILFIEGLKDYMKIYTEKEKDPILSLVRMKTFEDKLPQDKFCRVHRSYIVQISKCRIIERSQVTIGEKNIPISDNYKDIFLNKLQKFTIEV